MREWAQDPLVRAEAPLDRGEVVLRDGQGAVEVEQPVADGGDQRPRSSRTVATNADQPIRAKQLRDE